MNRPDEGAEDRHLPMRFVERCVETWRKHGQSDEGLQRAMLAASLNAMLEESEPADVAQFLHALAVEISPLQEVGHA